jgi:hypothetical protein
VSFARMQQQVLPVPVAVLVGQNVNVAQFFLSSFYALANRIERKL